MLDIFNTDAFSVVSLTQAADLLPYKPGRIGELGIFEQKPSTSRYAVIEERDGFLSLLPTAPRGASKQTTERGRRRKTKAFEIPHVPFHDTVLAEELMGKRAFGSEDQEEAFSEVLNDRIQQAKDDFEVTWEWYRLGAIRGVVLDADGVTEIENFFTSFGITQKTVTVDFKDNGNYDNAAPVQDMKQVCAAITRTVAKALGGARMKGLTAICGSRFYDSFVHHATVRKAYDAYTGNPFQAQLQTADATKSGFTFGEIEWEEYKGSIGDIDFVNTAQCHFIPRGVPGMFLECPGPADFIETVNTRGKMMYVKQKVLDFDIGVEVFAVSNVLYMCTRPSALVKGLGVNLDASIVVS